MKECPFRVGRLRFKKNLNAPQALSSSGEARLRKMVATKPDWQTCWAISGVLQCESGRPWAAGSSQARALTCTTSSGEGNPRATRARVFLQTRQAAFEETLPPHADDLAPGVESSSDSIVGQTFGGE
jgi:hypothetical protein